MSQQYPSSTFLRQTQKQIQKTLPKIETPDDSFDFSQEEAMLALAKLDELFSREQFIVNKKHLPTQSVEDLAKSILELTQGQREGEDYIDIRGMETQSDQKRGFKKSPSNDARSTKKNYISKNMNQKSKQILQHTSYQPIHLRTNQILQKKQEKVQQLTIDQQLQKLEKEQKEIEPLFTLNAEQNGPRRTVQQFLTDIGSWQQKKRQRHIDRQFQAQVQEQTTQTFKPSLNKKSIQIVEKRQKLKPNGFGCSSIVERMETQRFEKEEKKKAIELQLYQGCSFIPSINPRSARHKRQSSEDQKQSQQNRSQNKNQSTDRENKFPSESPDRSIYDHQTRIRSASPLISNLSQAFLQALSDALSKEKQNTNQLQQQQNQEKFDGEQSVKKQLFSENSHSKPNEHSFEGSSEVSLSLSSPGKHSLSQQPASLSSAEKQTTNVRHFLFSESSNHNTESQKEIEISAEQHREEIKRKLLFYRSLRDQLISGKNVSDIMREHNQSTKSNPEHNGREKRSSPHQSNSPLKKDHAINQIPYHPNLDFIINMLHKNEKPSLQSDHRSHSSSSVSAKTFTKKPARVMAEQLRI